MKESKTSTAADDVSFDPAAPADVQSLLVLARAFHAEDGHPLDAGGEEAIAQLPGELLARSWLVRRHGNVVGYVVLTLGFSIEHGGRDGFVDDLYVAPEARRQGLGARVVDFVQQQARALGVKALHLEVEIDNERAHELYRRMGFVESGRRLLSKRLCG